MAKNNRHVILYSAGSATTSYLYSTDGGANFSSASLGSTSRVVLDAAILPLCSCVIFAVQTATNEGEILLKAMHSPSEDGGNLIPGQVVEGPTFVGTTGSVRGGAAGSGIPVGLTTPFASSSELFIWGKRVFYSKLLV